MITPVCRGQNPNQIGKRNLSDAQRIEVALKSEDVIREKAKENYIRNVGRPSADKLCQKSDTIKIDTKKEVAALAGVSHDTVSKYKKVKAEAPPELLWDKLCLWRGMWYSNPNANKC